MIKHRVLMMAFGLACLATDALAQQKSITGRVTSDEGAPVPDVTVYVKGTNVGAYTNGDGRYVIRASPGQALQFRMIGFALEERTVGDADVINVQLRRVATKLDEMVVTALGQTAQVRALGTAQQTVNGAEIAQSQRTNFVNALQGRVSGVQVTSTSGVPGASTSITIRGTSSISSTNQPLFIIDGLPMDNKTFNTSQLASDAPNSTVAFSNRNVDFTNRAADINPDDIESLVVLKGPEAAALYGMDAANGAIIITTKRGRVGGGIDYNNSFSWATPSGAPEIQRVYGPAINPGSTTFLYFGAPWPDTTHFYNNVDGFFRTAMTQKHNIAFGGATPDNKVNYRISSGLTREEGVIPNSKLDRFTLTGASGVQALRWLRTDLTMTYSQMSNEQALKGENGPLIGLMVWPQNDNAANYLTQSGTRRKYTNLAAEVDNPYFSVNKNHNDTKNNRLIANVGLIVTPFSWGNLKTNLGTDVYTNQTEILRHPESALANSQQGIIDRADDVTRNLTAQTILNFNEQSLWRGLTVSAFVGHYIQDYKSTTDAANGQNFLDPNFISINSTTIRLPRTTISQERRLSGFGSVTFDWNRYLYLTATGRNDWTSTIPRPRNSFFYPGVNTSFIFSDAFPSLQRFMTGKLRAAYAAVGRGARPYADRPALISATTSFGGFRYDFWGPNPDLKPEFARSYEVGTELSFLHDRLGIDATTYRKETRDQIVNDIRGSYGTGFVLFNLNGATTRNTGIELGVRAAPVRTADFSWDVFANFDHSRGKVVSLPRKIPESYVSDTWLFGNVRNGNMAGLSTESLTGHFYLRNNKCQLLIDPTTGLPIQNANFVDAACGKQKGYDRHPDFTLGLTNDFKFKRFSLSTLLDFRKGGDVFNATESYLTARGLTMRTLDRFTPRVIPGVLRDGNENTANPTPNNIVVIPAVQTAYYTNMSEELFIEPDINWVRLKDVTLSYVIPERYLRNASVYVTGTDLFLITNYSGLDPVVNGNSAAVGGSGGVGIDFGNFPLPRTYSFGVRMGF